jgi:hypothetical protein
MTTNPWVTDDDQNLRNRAAVVMEAWQAVYPAAALALGSSDDFTRLRAAMRDLWKELR